MAAISITHLGLSTSFTGVTRNFATLGSPSVWQFRGIKFGNIPARFTQATLNETFSQVVDATAFGPKSPQPSFPARLEDVLIGTPPKVQPKNQPDVIDEFNCLNLNITMPPLNLDVAASLPVVVYIHGGGGFSGSNSDWWCDGGPLVSKSIAIGKPVIHVAINYRLSAVGFIGSSELRQGLGEINGGNYGFHDMQLALTWIARYISGFGGSSDQITLYGESFGSVGAEVLLHSNLNPFFSRCILQSELLGTPFFTPTESITTKSTVYQKTKDHLGVTTVKELQAVPVQDLIAALAASDPRSGLPHVPMMDDILLSENWRSKFSFARGRNGSVMIGNVGAESSVISIIIAGHPTPASPPTTSSLMSSLHGALATDKVQNLLSAYQIIDNPSRLNLFELRKNLLRLVEDLSFYRPPYALAAALVAKSTPASVYRYSFKKHNPFPGPFNGVSAHALDLAYIHGDPAIFTRTDNESAEIAFQDKIKKLWINFADGERVWDEKMWMGIGGDPRFEFDVRERTETQFDNDGPRLSTAWPAVDALSESDKEVAVAILMAHLAKMGGVDQSHVNGGA